MINETYFQMVPPKLYGVHTYIRRKHTCKQSKYTNGKSHDLIIVDVNSL